MNRISLRHGVFHLLLSAGLVWIAAGSAGCRTAAAPPMDPAMFEPDDRVLLAPGDEIEVKFFYSATLNETQKIRADGKVSLQLVGEVQAAGLTPQELEKDLSARYAKVVEKPDLAVILRAQGSRVVFVGGAVGEPGQIDMQPRFTILQAVMKAGGFIMDMAEVRRVVVIRQESGKYVGYPVDLEHVLTGETGRPFYLKPQDIVFVPRTNIADMNTWVEQHITRMIPQIGLPVFFQVN
jgi:polysaccharide export outer membrane protein